MILEQFEIENWSCIRRAAVIDLPVAGVVVLHGPNRTGKSSIVAALRATLFDYQPTSTKAELKRFFPNWTSDAPRVTIGFRAGGTSYRVTKQFKKGGDCRLEEKKTIEWSVITKSPAEVHDRTLALVGNKSSDQGLQQLLWLQQSEYRLPDKKVFDTDVQAQLRNILGVMQTSLDDAFIERVKERWKTWYTTRNQPGEQAKRTKACSLEKDLERLKQAEAELSECDSSYRAIGQSLERADYLESDARQIRSEVDQLESVITSLRDELNRSQAGLKAHELAKLQVASAEASVSLAKERQNEQTSAAVRWREAQDAVTAAQAKADLAAKALAGAEQSREELQQEAKRVREEARVVRNDLGVAEAQHRLMQEQTALATLREKKLRAEELHGELHGLKLLDLQQPAPTHEALAKLVNNRADAARHRAELNAAAILLVVTTEPGAEATLSVDGGVPAALGASIRGSIQRRAELVIGGWGRIEIARGSDARGLDEIEGDLGQLDRDFREEVAPYGLTDREPDALEQLRRAAAERDLRAADRARITSDIKRIGAMDLELVRSELSRREMAVQTAAAELTAAQPVVEPGKRADFLRNRLAALDAKSDELETAVQAALNKIEEKSTGCRVRADQAQTTLAATQATARAEGAALDRLAAPSEMAAALAEAEQAMSNALAALSQAQLSDEEMALPERLATVTDGHKQLKEREEEVREELHKLQGALSKSAGLHQSRADAAALVDALKRKTEREILESRAYDRLYELFEECRQKQLSTVAGPITDRVLRWMRQTGITDYGAIECGDNFLPHSLTGKDGRLSLPIEHESTGAQEQIALMVRLALGSVIAPPVETSVAVLDDPLTHSDPLRLDRMRAILKAAAAGDPSATPSVWPLQILVFTCRPEWFRVDAAPMIDLGNPMILERA